MALSWFVASCGFKVIVNDGFFGFFVNRKISSIRGTPRVTFDLDATPTLWKVFKVNCVVGSPTDCAAMTPTISPGWTNACLYFKKMVSNNNCIASL